MGESFRHHPPSCIRRAALEKLAVLATKHPRQDDDRGNSDVERLIRACHGSKAASGGSQARCASSGVRELDVLLALCKAASSVQRGDHAAKLVSLLAGYLPTLHTLRIHSSPFLHTYKPSPWETLTHDVVTALLSLGSRHKSLQDDVHEAIDEYLENCHQATDRLPAVFDADGAGIQVDSHEFTDVTTLMVSLVGFLRASSEFPHFWAPLDRLAIVKQLHIILSERFLVAVETISSGIRNSRSPDPLLHDWRRYTRQYAADGRPLGSMLLQQAFIAFLKSCTSPVESDGASPLPDDTLLSRYAEGDCVAKTSDPGMTSLVKYAAELAGDQINLLEEGSDYLQVSSTWQQRLAFLVKALSVMCSINCIMVDQDSVDLDLLFTSLDNTIADPDQMMNRDLATVVLKAAVVLARLSRGSANGLTRSLLRFIVQNGQSSPVVALAAQCLAQNLRLLSQDTVIGTLYSLGNVLSSGSAADKATTALTAEASNGYSHSIETRGPPTNESFLSLAIDGEGDTSITARNVVHAIVTIATSSEDSKIVALAQSILVQKIGKVNVVVDAYIIQETAALSLKSEPAEFRLLLKFYSRLLRDTFAQGNNLILEAIHKARNSLAVHLNPSSEVFRIYLVYLLEGLVNQGAAVEREKVHPEDLEATARQIVPILKPLAILLARAGRLDQLASDNDDISDMLRDAWFNIAAHDISLHSGLGKENYEQLRILAEHSPPLVSENRAEQLESDIELNTILRRGQSPQTTVEKKKNLTAELPAQEHDIRRLNYPKVLFLNAALLIETLRANSGDCTKVFTYFLDPTLNTSEMGNCMRAIADKVVTVYLEKALRSTSVKFSAPYIAKQLADTFTACCHRIVQVQQTATLAANKIITQCPSALCQKLSLFTLLDLITLLWSSCMDEEMDEFAWESTFTSSRGTVQIVLSDNYDFRRRTLKNLHNAARTWISSVMNMAPLDIKGLLQTYLSDYDDDGVYGHITMGRSLALEMGSAIPLADQRLGSIDNPGGTVLNVASDFISQYTTRQEYRYSEAAPARRGKSPLAISYGQTTTARVPDYPDTVQEALAALEHQIRTERHISLDLPRHILRRTAALLCNTDDSHPAIIAYLVNIPFQIFTKESIRMGIALWLGVINEKPAMESRILVEIAQAWERTIRRKQGIFDPKFKHKNPFMNKLESSPSDKEAIVRRHRKAQNIISPHFLVLRFLESHFSASRLGSLNTQQVFRRLVSETLTALRDSTGHPLAREIHFHTILFSLKVLHSFSGQSNVGSWKLKDQILSAALSWFGHPPSWSFGGNRLQLKAEDQILHDIESMLETVSWKEVVDSKSRKSLQAKHDLLLILIGNERSRLKIWLSPLDLEKKSYFFYGTGSKTVTEETVTGLLRLAWNENPSLALQLGSRFPSAKLRSDIRWLLLNFPEKALKEPNALEILLGPSLPEDVSFQLKYLLYWEPIDPISAVTYLLPAYGNHPFILQYALRSLESFPVDVGLFYIPQLVQALRYDALGYIERYLLNTAQLSQMFAHQVIWNMKANAYKDEDSQIPDPLKPVLDRFMDCVITSFTDEDREFYEREFAFFNEITGISGKLRPYIKRTKQEKKEKIAEELRKIKVEVGVYLPSNPDGVVVGIDRKSGKPLQSHAKAPYMATFRIKKTRSIEDGSNAVTPAEEDVGQEEAGLQLSQVKESAVQSKRESLAASQAGTYEVWQSAIFKVGDDCRQDVLALQMIAAFREIFASVGLDVFVFPYRVVATAPGCGVIDVLPNSISRDMLGREAVNGLYDYFVSKYGGEQSIKFQEARSNFVKSMAAYSVISYLLQFKDRHNGNIMIDDAGHILHIDFGFCFDIAPGGVRFERAPFKLTTEMIAVMGGYHPASSTAASATPSTAAPSAAHTASHSNSQSYRWFESLVVKAFLASRPYTMKLSNIVTLMLDSGLPCFTPHTLTNFRDRFVLEKSEQEAAQYMRELIRKSYASMSTKGYDQFQLMTNNIPY
ncbi:phosphatidylinositol 4-kinase STT4 [Nannizzia gypsea CBS 118893]|uniref:1-phosphatidylinositol 4-kinase n=1 Tax=Arthroderma gypseum (strain ATCC MYA-4604 / CBS 118893) TaxID=535722 RepID=E4UWV1_ARTGP|nr:phosphatidylinositol 4-kinase STT4 [Nannizzia gypsea CBS 118893]EFR01804.1 phosphatidylinositol 4-kinase STT4 [Nannizzia gypsea CBS 118893]